jgi:hypothetical protein
MMYTNRISSVRYRYAAPPAQTNNIASLSEKLNEMTRQLGASLNAGYIEIMTGQASLIYS